MCRRKFVWRQGTKYVVGLQKYWVTSKTVGSQHFPEALHVFQPSGLVRLVVRRRIKRGVFPREFSPSWKTFSWPIRGTRKNPLNTHIRIVFIDYRAEQEVEEFVARPRPIRRTNAKLWLAIEDLWSLHSHGTINCAIERIALPVLLNRA